MSEEHEQIVKDEITKLLSKNKVAFNVSCIDDITLSYVVSVLEELDTEDEDSDTFDLDEFIEIMKEYLPGFGKVDREHIQAWLYPLAKKLLKSECEQFTKPVDLTDKLSQLTQSTAPTTNGHHNGHQRRRTSSNCSNNSDSAKEGNSRIRYMSDASDDAQSEQIAALLEMFPTSCSLEVSHCLTICHNDTDKTAQLILLRQENGESLKEIKSKSSNLVEETLDARAIRDNIVNRYGYVHVGSAKKEYKPDAPKKEPKVLIRYLDSKVVSTRGERFTEIKKPDDEEMKKTYVNLKPAKQY